MFVWEGRECWKSLDQHICAKFVLWGEYCEWTMSSDKQLCSNSLTKAFDSKAVCLSLEWTHANTQTFKECRAGSGLLLSVLHWPWVVIQDSLQGFVPLQWSLQGRPVSNQLYLQAQPCGNTAAIKQNFSYAAMRVSFHFRVTWGRHSLRALHFIRAVHQCWLLWDARV